MKPITFSTTIAKKVPVTPAKTPSARPMPPQRKILAPQKKAPLPPPAPSKGQPVRPSINVDAFYRFPITEPILIQKKESAPSPAPKLTAPQNTPAPHLRTYAALKTAKMQHEQILSRIGK